MYLMSKIIEAIPDSLIDEYHATASQLNVALHSYGIKRINTTVNFGENRSISVAGRRSSCTFILIQAFTEPPEQDINARFIFRNGVKLDIANPYWQYVDPREIGVSALEQHIELAASARAHIFTGSLVLL